MASDELFPDNSGAPEHRRQDRTSRRGPSRRLGAKGVIRLVFGLVLVFGTFAGLTVEGIVTAGPAAAASATYTCTTPASGGTSVTFYTGVTNSQSIACYGVSGVSGTTAYPASISLNTGSLPPGTTEATSTSSTPACTTSTSGSGTTEEYILTCPISDNPTPAQAGSYPVTFTANPGTDGGTALNSGTDTITVSNTTQACIDPASGGTAQKFDEGYTNTYTVECENQTHVSGQAEYPSSIAITTGTGPADAPVTFATSTSSTPACTQSTSGSGTSEQYILSCAFSFAPTTSDAGTYPFTFTPTTNGVAGPTSGALTITVGTPTLTCTAPAAAGTATTFNSSNGGTNNSYSVACYGVSGETGLATYPTSIVPTTPASLPADLVSATSTSSTPACTKSTSGSGTTEEYILTCPQTEDAVSADNGPYSSTYTATDSNSGATTTSGAWNLTVTGPSDVCTSPASGGTATTFKVGIANTFSVTCYGTGFASASAGNYPSAITVNTGSLPGDATFQSVGGSPACTTSTSGSGNSEEYIDTCTITETPTASDVGTYPVTFTATPGANGGSTVTTGTWTLTVAGINPTCIDPASGGTSSTFYENVANSYTVECEAQSGVSGTAAYPNSINFNTGALPADGNPTLATSTSSTPACTHGTSGSGTTEEYILECTLTDTPTSSDAGSYPLTFTATGPGGAGTGTSGTLTVNVTPPTTTCTAPASGGTSTSWVDGTAESYSVACYSSGFASASPGNYPTSITLNTGTLPSGATEATSTTSSPACTQSTSGSGVSEEYILTCPVAENPTLSQNGTYHATFLATGGANGGPNATSGTWTLTVSQPAPSWATDGSTDGNYFSAIKGVPFCYDLAVSVGQATNNGTFPGSTGSLPLTSLTAGATPSGVTNYSVQDVNLAAGTAQICGTDNNTAASAPVTMAPVATNSGGSATGSIPLWSQNECTWSSSGATVSMFDANQDLEQSGSQSAFGQPITNGVVGGTTKDEPTCSGGVGVSASGGLGDAWTMNTANPLPSPTDTNPSASQGALASSNLDLTTASTGSVGGCYGAINILASTSTSAFGSSTASMTLPSSWVNGGDCAYGTLGSNSAGGNTDTPALHGPTGDAACPPNQADVNAGLVNCSITLSSGNDENGSTNYTTMDLFYNGQPVPQAPTATLSAPAAQPGDTVSVTGGTNWWGASSGAPNAGPYGDFQNSSSDFYPVSAPQIYIGTSRATAVPVASSTVAINADAYACTGAESTTVAPNPCTLTVGQPTGSFTVPSGLAPGIYNVYIDESNTTPLPGNGPNDAYQTARGTSLGTVESATPLDVEGVMVVKTSTTAYADGGYSEAGDTITYTFAVTNTGPDTVTGITVADSNIPSAAITCPNSSLAAGASENCTGTYTVTQADVDNGSVTNTATVSATSISGETLTSAPSSVTTDASDTTSSLSLTKSATTSYSDGGYGKAGDVIDYSYLVTNTGTTTESAITVSDNLIPTVSCPPGSLAPGASETCTGSYTVTQGDVDSGSVTNTATASGTNPSHSTATSNSSTVTVEATDASSSIAVVKSSSSSYQDGAYGKAGDVIDYQYLVSNTGTTTLSDWSVSDNLIPNVSCPSGTLAPGASETCTGSYTVTQADVDAGSVTNTATASATNPSDGSVTSSPSSVTVDASDATSSLSLVKSTNSNGYGVAGNVIAYRYLVTNTGTTTESGIAVSDSLIPAVSCPSSSLAPGASETCTGSYTVTQADVDAGSVTNTATAGGTALGGSVTSAVSSVTVDASNATTSLSLSKSSTTSSYRAAGDVIDYSYLVTNTGTTTESGIAVSDNLIPDVSCPSSSLAPGASETCTGSYTVTQADVDAGSVTNTATASGTALGGSVTSAVSSVTVPASTSSSLSLTKSTGSSGYGAAGNVIDYSYLVTNTGTTTLTGVGVSDNLIPDVSCPSGTLAPGASETCTGSYTVAQADVDAGSVTNTATATATNPSDHAVSSGSSTVTVDASAATSSLGLSKSTSSNGYGAAGDVIGYSYLVTNTGTTTESGIAVSDNLIPDVSCPPGPLAPGASETCTGSYTVTQGDVDAGSVTNTATASAVNPQSVTETSATSSLTVHASHATSGLSLTKSTSSSGYGAAGNVIDYSYVVTNTGTTTESGIAVSDNLIPDVSCPSGTLAPGASETCTGSYTVTQSDVDAGSVTNTASASGTNPSHATETSNSSTVTVDASGATSSLSLSKSTSSNGYAKAGDVIDYSYLVTNTGTTTESGIAVSDNLIPAVSCPSSSLAPGASETCTGSYTATQGDVDAGSVTNTATASGTALGGSVTSGSSSVTVEASGAASSLSITKSTTSTGYGAAGDTIDYSYLVTNTGTTTLTGVGVSDNRIPDVSCLQPTLAPGASETCTGSYTVTQADVDAGSVTNTATASATDPQDAAVTSGSSSVTVDAAFASSDLGLVKATSSSGYGRAGDVIAYTYQVTNTGTTTVSGVGVSDNRVGGVTCPQPTLAPGASETCTGSYTVTQADVDAGSVTNTASAHGTAIHGSVTVTSDPSSVTVEASSATSSLSLVKSASPTSFTVAGQVLSYSYKVTNTGTTTLSSVAVSDNLIATVSCPSGSLAPGASATCTGSYTTTQQDVDYGSITNSATARATAPPHSTPVTSNSSTLTLDYAGVTITSGATLPALTLGTPYSYTMTATGGVAPYKWTAVSGLPKGLKLSSKGVLSGTVLAKKVAPGTYTLVIQVADHGRPKGKDVGFFTLTVKG